MHPDVARLVGLAHEVADGVFFGHFEVEICFHAAVVDVRRHGVPHASGLQFGHAHLELACLDHAVDNHAIDLTVVGAFERTEHEDVGILFRHLFAWIFGMSRSRIEI